MDSPTPQPRSRSRTSAARGISLGRQDGRPGMAWEVLAGRSLADLHAASPPTYPPRGRSSSQPLSEGVGDLSGPPSESPRRWAEVQHPKQRPTEGSWSARLPGGGGGPPFLPPQLLPLLPSFHPEARPARSPSGANFANGSQVAGRAGSWVGRGRRGGGGGLPGCLGRGSGIRRRRRRPLADSGPSGEGARQDRSLARCAGRRPPGAASRSACEPAGPRLPPSPPPPPPGRAQSPGREGSERPSLFCRVLRKGGSSCERMLPAPDPSRGQSDPPPPEDARRPG